MSETAPSCPINRSQPTQKARQPPAPDIANIPHVNDLRTVINALNQLRNVMQHITRGAPQVNNVYPTTTGGVPQPPQDQGPPPQYKQMVWEESSRSYMQQKIINPEDKSQEIEIKTLSSVEWRDRATGQSLRYTGA